MQLRNIKTTLSKYIPPGKRQRVSKALLAAAKNSGVRKSEIQMILQKVARLCEKPGNFT